MFFYTRILGGAWTMRERGMAADAVSGFARAWVRRWCKLYAWPTSARFSLGRYGRASAHALCREWCHRSEFFYKLWSEAGEAEGFELSAAHGGRAPRGCGMAGLPRGFAGGRRCLVPRPGDSRLVAPAWARCLGRRCVAGEVGAEVGPKLGHAGPKTGPKRERARCVSTSARLWPAASPGCHFNFGPTRLGVPFVRYIRVFSAFSTSVPVSVPVSVPCSGPVSALTWVPASFPRRAVSAPASSGSFQTLCSASLVFEALIYIRMV